MEAIMAGGQRLLELALMGLQAERVKIDNEIAEIRSQLNHEPATTGATGATKKKTMSAEARRRISEGMKRRYAEIKERGQHAQQVKHSQRGGLTAAGRKKLSEMMKAR